MPCVASNPPIPQPCAAATSGRGDRGGDGHHRRMRSYSRVIHPTPGSSETTAESRTLKTARDAGAEAARSTLTIKLTIRFGTQVRRLQGAGAIAVVIVNEGWGTFQPKIVTENLASVDAILVPVHPPLCVRDIYYTS